ncbi:MAG TPA: glycosyltransferase [Ramlibacter sp.]|nr:glycosyltransferase [Ramlibacter sp.]
MTKTIDLMYFNAGGGHRAAAMALEAVLRGRGQGFEVRKTNVMEVLDPTGLFKRVTGMAPEDYYNKRLASGFTMGLAQELKVFQGTIRLAHGALVRRLEQHWLRSEPDLVVSLIPNLNRPLCASLASALPGVPFLTVMTDLADHSPDFWIVPDQPQHLVCGTDRAMEQASALGCDPARVRRASGMILRPDFYAEVKGGRDMELRALGLDPTRPTGLVLFGGHGSRTMARIAQDLADVQLILLCGHNAALAAKLRKMPCRTPRAVVGFTSDVPHYMRLADFFIGKPGPGSLSEAVHCGLPVVTVRNGWTMPQERYNTEWITRQGLGVAGTSFSRLREPVHHLLARLHDYTARVRAMPPNRAVFEIAGMIEGMLEEDFLPPAPLENWLAATRAVGMQG